MKPRQERKLNLLGRAGIAARAMGLPKVGQTLASYGGNLRFYQNAWPSRSRAWWLQAVYDGKEQVDQWSRERIMAETRRLRANVPFLTSPVRCLSTHAVGNAWAPQFRTGNPQWDEQAAQFISNWFNICDIRGLFTFQQLLEIACEAIDIDGDFGINLVDEGYPLLQFIHGNRIASAPNSTNSKQGVIYNGVGRPLAFSIKQDDGTFKEIPASNFLLLGDPMMFDHGRYIGSYANCTDVFEDIRELHQIELIGTKTLNSRAIVEYNETGMFEPPNGNYFGSTTGQTNLGGTNGQSLPMPTQLSIPGETYYAKIGNKVEAFDSNRPSQAWHGLMEHLMKQPCFAMDLPYEFVVAMDKLNGTAARAILQRAIRTIQRRQRILGKAAKRIVGWRVAKAIKRGELPANDKWWRVDFQLPKLPTVDSGRELKGVQDGYKLGLQTLDAICAEEGTDWVEHRTQREAELLDVCERAKRLSDKYAKQGLTFAMALSRFEQFTPNANEIATAAASEQQAKEK